MARNLAQLLKLLKLLRSLFSPHVHPMVTKQNAFDLFQDRPVKPGGQQKPILHEIKRRRLALFFTTLESSDVGHRLDTCVASIRWRARVLEVGTIRPNGLAVYSLMFQA